MIIAITKEGFINRTPKSEFKVQQIGKTENIKKFYSKGINIIKEATLDETLLLFTNGGKCYKIKVSEIPSTTISEIGISLNELFGIRNETFCTLIPIKSFYTDEELNNSYILIMTRYWKIVRQKLKDYIGAKNGITTITLNEGDQLVSAVLCTKEKYLFNCNIYSRGKIFNVEDVPINSLSSKPKGVLCGNGSYLQDIKANNKTYDTFPINLDKDEDVNTSCIIVTSCGYIGRVNTFLMGRATFGPYLLTLRENDYVAFNAFANDKDDLLIVSTSGYNIRFNIGLIKTCKREIKGQLGIKLLENDRIEACCKISAQEDSNTIHEISKWDDYQFIQKQKAIQYRQQGLFIEELSVIEETINTLKQEGISNYIWVRLHEIRKNNLNASTNHAEKSKEQIYDFLNNKNKDNTTIAKEPDSKHLKDDQHERMAVPSWFNICVWSIRDLQSGSTSQKRFYRYFKENFLKGNYIDIEGNTNYAFLLMYDLRDTYHSNLSLLNDYYQHLVEICPKVKEYTVRILKDIIIENKRKELKEQLIVYSTRLQSTHRWIGKNEVVEIGGVRLYRGNFYIGNCFKLPQKILNNNTYNYNCSHIYGPVINPVLPIQKGDAEDEYFCSYQDMTPTQRYEYLKWLSAEYPTEKTCAEFIRYYVYGLEVRLFIDNALAEECKQIITQLSELYNELISLDRNLYIEHCELAETIKEIISTAIVMYYPSSAGEFLPVDELMSCDDYLDYYINQILYGKTELTPEDAYSIAKKTNYFRDLPVILYERNIKDQFISIFQKRFRNYSIIQSNEYYLRESHCIRTNYEGDLYCPEDVNMDFNFPKRPIDTSLIKRPIYEITRKLEEDFYLYNNCIKWTNTPTLLTLLQLPEYIKLEDNNSIYSQQEFFYSMLERNEYHLIDVNYLLDSLGYIRKNEKSLYLQPIQAITNGLNKLKIRIVPLIDINNKNLNFGDKCIIYKTKGVSKVKRTDTYSRIELFIKLAIQLIQADGCNNSDMQFIDKYIETHGDTSGNIRHLKGYFRWLQHKKQPFNKSTKDSINKLLDKGQCKKIVHLLLKLSCNLGDINNKRVDVLTKIFPLLGEDVNNVHSHIHRMLTDDEDFATVEVTTDAKEYVIAQPESQSKRKQKIVKIDTAKLSKLEAQTASAQNMLSEIFIEDENVTSTITSNHSPLITILTRLLTKSEWSKAEVDSICKELNVITGSILEQINDYAYDKVDDVVIEDEDDIIYVNTDYKDQLI